ncbi:helical backbone metal receptor [Umezawaea sp. Da 62-37]|uniref:helical backbone metal receptor n=1 Tax=Umezawaea sp. Da 62-37 TaxID=3075927 RepID=UPI0028F6C9AB|nr:helical backbone metal receptor [Umezawaea sp. Da 62-37]WNV82543.1 helical backbone metal receptor [Umezawaea sp. Da 62-37]
MLPVDDLGEPVPIPDRPRRVVSLVPSLTDSVPVESLVGVTDYCPVDTTRIGGSKYPDVDRVLALGPDLVLTNVEENRAEDVERLRANGIAVWVTAAPATVPQALASIRRLLATAWDVEPDWLVRSEEVWRHVEPVWATAVVPVWRRPWVVLGRDTFAGDVLRRLGVANAYADDPERYPRPSVEDIRAKRADLVVLPDEPYAFSATDGPEAFPGTRCELVSGRHLTWYGPSLVEAREVLDFR